MRSVLPARRRFSALLALRIGSGQLSPLASRAFSGTKARSSGIFCSPAASVRPRCFHRRDPLLIRQLAQIVPSIEAGVVRVIEHDSDRVVADGSRATMATFSLPVTIFFW